MKKAKITNSEIQDINTQYGLDIEEQMTNTLVNELSKEIDREILRSMGLEPDINKRRKRQISDILNNINK